jgi:hypothetical protein
MIEAIKEVLTAVDFPGKDEPPSVTGRNIDDADVSKTTSNGRAGIGGEVDGDFRENNYRSDLSLSQDERGMEAHLKKTSSRLYPSTRP